MGATSNLSPGRGTKLFVAANQSIGMQLKFDDLQKSARKLPWNRILFLHKGRIDWLQKFYSGIDNHHQVSIEIDPQSPFMVMNLTQTPLSITTDKNLSGLTVLFDPYIYEHETHENYIPDHFLDRFQIPQGYADSLAKWYSVKFTFENYNLILIRPNTGLSFQTHRMRGEHWEILHGDPIVIAGTDVFYSNPPNTERDLPLGTLHSIINPSSSEWVMFKETYHGTFEEEDIIRVFNPNYYFSH